MVMSVSNMVAPYRGHVRDGRLQVQPSVQLSYWTISRPFLSENLLLMGVVEYQAELFEPSILIMKSDLF